MIDDSEHSPSGRKPKITKKIEKLILDAVAEGQTMIYICEKLKLNRQTEWLYRKSHDDYRLKLEATLDMRDEIVEDALYSKAVGGDVTAVRFWLTNRAGNKWKNIQDSRVGGDSSGVPVQIGVREILVEIPTSSIDSASTDDESIESSDGE